MGGTFFQTSDPIALAFIAGAVIFAAVIITLEVRRRRGRIPRWMRSKLAPRRIDLITLDFDRIADYVRGVSEGEPTAWQPFERGLTALQECRLDQALVHFETAELNAGGVQLVALRNQVGVCRHRQGNLAEALREFQQAARLAEQQKDGQGRAIALNNIGVIRHDYGELNGALKQLREALALARAAVDRPTVALCLGNVGNVLRDKGDIPAALRSQEDALAVARPIMDHEAVATCLCNIGAILRERGDPDQALERYAEAVETARKADYKLGVANGFSNIGSLYRSSGELDRALKAHESSLALFHEIHFRPGIATGLGNIGLVLVAKNMHERAAPYLAESLTFFLTAGTVRGPRQALFGLSQCDDTLGRERMLGLLQRAGLGEDTVSEMLDRVDQIRTRRPRSRSRRHPFAPPPTPPAS